jgi:hypothetical protein
MPKIMKNIAIWNMKPCSFLVILFFVLNIILFYFSLTQIPLLIYFFFHFIPIDICPTNGSLLLAPPVPVALLKALAPIPSDSPSPPFPSWVGLILAYFPYF